MKNLKSELNKYIDDFFKKHKKLPDKEILSDFKREYKKFYLKRYRQKNIGDTKRINLTLTKQEFDLII